jgi:hypothetical protein
MRFGISGWLVCPVAWVAVFIGGCGKVENDKPAERPSARACPGTECPVGLEWLIEDQYQRFEIYQGFSAYDQFRLSGDGNVVIGTRWDEGAFRWDMNRGLQWILLWDSFSDTTPIGQVVTTEDGANVFVYVSDHTGGASLDESYRWTQATGAVKVSDMLWVNDVSADGSMLLGAIECNLSRPCDAAEYPRVLRSAEDDQLVPQATHLSGDGLTVAGATMSTGFVWTPPGPRVLFSKTLEFMTITDVNQDGTVVVGFEYEHQPSGTPLVEAFRWTSVDGTQPLGMGTAEAVSADGRVVVGVDGTGEARNSRAMIWTVEVGARLLDDVLQEAGVLPDGAVLWTATDVSDDGHVVVGLGMHEDRWLSYRAVVP